MPPRATRGSGWTPSPRPSTCAAGGGRLINSTIDLLAVQATEQQALARGWRDAALLMKAGALPYIEAAGKALLLLKMTAETLQRVGAYEALASMLLARAELVEALPLRAAAAAACP